MPSVQPLRTPVEYPESDGKPMAETPRHWDATVDATQPLQRRYRDRPRVYVGSDMMMYHEEGNPRVYVSPDVFVAFDVRPDEPRRDIWKTWEEGKLADFVVEVTSISTQGEDEHYKRKLYQRLGVREYWQFDPTGDYLDPILKFQRLDSKGVYELVPLKTAADGALYGVSEVLGLHLCLDGDRLRYRDPATGPYLPTSADKDRRIEHLNQRVESQDRQLAEKERTNADQAQALEAARAEIEALRQRLADR